jgi:hypothetical protein
VIALTIFATTSIASPRIAHAEDAKPAAPNAPTTSPDQPGPAKFYGTVSAVDTKAQTFTVDNQVYHVVGETHMTKAADDSKAALEESLVGEAARGTYTKSGDGTLNVTKVRFGKKTGAKSGGKGGGKKGDDAAQTEKKS